MIIRTVLQHHDHFFRDRLEIPEIDLQGTHPLIRADAIRTARIMSYARCLNAWRAYMNQQTKKP